jgi:hypothetical protein
MASREPAGSLAAAPASRGRGRGPGGPGLTLELDGEAVLTGGEAGGEEFGAAAVETCEEETVTGGD